MKTLKKEKIIQRSPEWVREESHSNMWLKWWAEKEEVCVRLHPYWTWAGVNICKTKCCRRKHTPSFLTVLILWIITLSFHHQGQFRHPPAKTKRHKHSIACHLSLKRPERKGKWTHGTSWHGTCWVFLLLFFLKHERVCQYFLMCFFYVLYIVSGLYIMWLTALKQIAPPGTNKMLWLSWLTDLLIEQLNLINIIRAQFWSHRLEEFTKS